jgi:nitrite reductase/ring-hydroxylating ferredoxin subunit
MALIGFVKAILGICETPPLDAGLWMVEGNQVTIRLGEATALAHAGAAARLEGNGLVSSVLIVHTGDHYLAFENRCTHRGRRLDPIAGRDELRCCSVNHSRFDYEGNKVFGPAEGSLKRYAVEKRSGELVVILSGVT